MKVKLTIHKNYWFGTKNMLTPGAILLLALFIGGGTSPTGDLPVISTGKAYEEAEAIFRNDPRWLGADAALSIPLGDHRILWLFGDTFIATSVANTRSESEMIRNSIAIQEGNNPETAPLSFYWKDNKEDLPTSFFPEDEERWYWPGHGVRSKNGPLIIFLYAFIATPGEGLGFAHAGFAVATIDDPDVSPKLWKTNIINAPKTDFDAIPATAVIQDDAHIIALAIRQNGIHAGALVRYPLSNMEKGDLNSSEWWMGKERGWVPESLIGADGPMYIIDDAGSECSIHWDERSNSFIHIASYGFGASIIGMRTAKSITGPWSTQQLIYTPPESNGPRPFVYAAKAHPELRGPSPEDLVITYATNSFDFNDLFLPEKSSTLYWPRFVTVGIGK